MRNLQAFATACLCSSIVASARAQPSEAPAQPQIQADSSPSSAERPAPGSKLERHHQGFFLRSFAGAGYRTLTARSDSGDVRVYGAGMGTGFAVGGAVLRDLLLHADFVYETAENPTLQTAERKVSVRDARAEFVALGGGVSYYLMPANVHLGLSALLCKATIGTKQETLGVSEWGYGAALRAGKSFWVGKDFGIGALAQVTLARMNDTADADGNRAKLSSTTATLAFEMTYH